MPCLSRDPAASLPGLWPRIPSDTWNQAGDLFAGVRLAGRLGCEGAGMNYYQVILTWRAAGRGLRVNVKARTEQAAVDAAFIYAVEQRLPDGADRVTCEKLRGRPDAGDILGEDGQSIL